MTTLILITALSLGGGSPDDGLPGFDYGLLAKIQARNAAKRARYGNHSYDPETWLPVPEKKPEHPRPPRHVRAKRSYTRRPTIHSGGDPLWWIQAPAMPNPRCPWSYVVLPALPY